jgi:carboxyl-terminal processing protease
VLFRLSSGLFRPDFSSCAIWGESGLIMKFKRNLLLILALLLPITFAGAHTEQRGTRAGSADYATTRRISDDFVSAIMTAKENYAGSVDYDRVTKGSISGMLRTLDPHSTYFDRKDWEEFQNDQRSRYFGIGSTIAGRGDKVYILSPTAGTPSYRAGLRYGDQFVEINGESAAGLNSTQIRSKLLGPEGTTVTFKVARLGVDSPIEFKIVRAAVPLPSIANYFMVADGVGYVNLERGFNTTTYDEMEEALSELRNQGLKSLILDLRGNHGGLVDQAIKVCNTFLYNGQKILSMRGRPGVFPPRDYFARNTSPDDYPVVVLINRGSASAAEIVAGALQDHDRARLVGESSFGKGLVQNPFPLSDHSALVLTTGHYYTPSGRLIQREYEGRSFYDYYLRRGDDSAVHHTEQKRTDSGRAVYGGGGIDPDVSVKARISPHDVELQRIWFEPVFLFARELVAGKFPSLNEFRINRSPDHSHRLAANEYQVGDKVIPVFKTWVRDHKELKLDESRVDKDADYLRRQIRYEVVTAAYGIENAYQVALEADTQMQRALAEIPAARVMADDSRRTRGAPRVNRDN